MVRLGAAYYGNPYKNINGEKGNRIQLSGGLGYRNKGVFVDLTYVYAMNKDVHYPYRLEGNTFDAAAIKNNVHDKITKNGIGELHDNKFIKNDIEELYDNAAVKNNVDDKIKYIKNFFNVKSNKTIILIIYVVINIINQFNRCNIRIITDISIIS